MSDKSVDAFDSQDKKDFLSTRRSALKKIVGGVAGGGLLGGLPVSSAWAAGASTAGGSSALPLSGATSVIDMPAWELSLQIHAKKVSCKEVMTAYLDQIDKVNPTVNAIVALVDRDALMKQAAEKDAALSAGKETGWMHGFPQAIKDLENTKGIRTTYGSPVYKDFIPEEDSLMVKRMKSAGIIVVGKTNTPEWGYGSQTYNPVYGASGNPYDPSKTTGGSSGGAACSVAVRMQPVADGSDFMGSLRNPAGWCGIFGYRPSWGRTPPPGKELFYNQFAVNGPMGSSVPDIALLLTTQAGYDLSAPSGLADDPNLSALTPMNVCDRLKADHKGKRIAWLGDWNGYLPMEKGVLDVCQKALATFNDMGVAVEPIKNPTDPLKLWQEVWLPHRHICASSMKDLCENPKTRALTKPEAIWEYEGSKNYSAQDTYFASLKRSDWYRTILQVFEKYDYIAVPTAQVFAFDKTIHWPKEIAGKSMDTYHRWMEVVTAWTLTGCPVVAIPAGFNAKGESMGIQIIGKPRGDWDVLRLAYAYELATDIVRKNRPKIA